VFDFLWNLSSFIVALGILITVHEYGHYWVAKKNGVKVERFSIGFGKALWRKVDKSGTEFVIALIPLGGYVKMLDERVDDVALEDIDKTFNCKTVYQRIAIIAAGPLANFVFALFAFYLMFLIGVPSIKPVTGTIKADSIAAHAQMKSQSQIMEVAGQKTLEWQDVNLALVSQIGEASIQIKAKPVGSATQQTYTLDTTNWQFEGDKVSAIESLGLSPFRPQIYTEVAAIAKDSPAEKAGLILGDKLIAINDKNIKDSWSDFSEEIKKFPSKEIKLTVIRENKKHIIVATPDTVERNGEKLGYLGISPRADAYPDEYQIELTYGPIEAIDESINRTWNLITLSFKMIGKLITGDISVKNLSGPIAIAKGAGDHADYGFVYFLGFLALISINLGIINILPIPVLDGGHLVYYLIELFTGKPVSEKVQEIGFRFGTLALLGLMSIALFNDLSRL